MMRTCKHCSESFRVDPADDQETLCPECYDLAVWGAPCDLCGEYDAWRKTCECARR